MKAYKIILTIALMAGLFGAVSAVAQPGMVNYQGKLTDDTGAPVTDTLSIVFSIYDVATNGTPLWTETQSSVAVLDGIYNVLLGSTTPIPDAVFDGNDRWLGVTVGSDLEMSPRQRIASVGYAINSDMVDGQHASDFGDGHSLDAADSSPTDAVYVDNGGNVGIGTTLPEAKLHVVDGLIRVKNSTADSDAGLVLSGTGDSQAAYVTLADKDTGKFWHIANAADDENKFKIWSFDGLSWVLAMSSDINNGNVGIGTTNPGAKLEVTGQVKITGGSPGEGRVLTSDASGLASWQEVTVAPGDGSISQAKLKTAVGEVSASNGHHTTTLPGGQYGFFPETKMNTSSTYRFGAAIVGSVGEINWINIPGWTSYRTNISLYTNNSSATIYARQRYVTSSGVDHWIFLLIDKATEEILSAYSAPDHPCYGNGGNPSRVPHPFLSHEETKHEIAFLDKETVRVLQEESMETGRSILTLVTEEYKPDMSGTEVYEPLHSGLFLGDEPVMIEKLPEYIKVRKLVRLSAHEKEEQELRRQEEERQRQLKELEMQEKLYSLKQKLNLTDEELKLLTGREINLNPVDVTVQNGKSPSEIVDRGLATTNFSQVIPSRPDFSRRKSFEPKTRSAFVGVMLK